MAWVRISKVLDRTGYPLKLPPVMLERLRTAAAANKRSVNSEIQMAIQHWLWQEEAENGDTTAGERGRAEDR